MTKYVRATVRNMQQKHTSGTVAACLYHPWERYSADPSDYFMAHPDTVLTCSECGKPLVLARFREVMETA